MSMHAPEPTRRGGPRTNARTLNCSILDSMSLRASVRFFLSLMSFIPSHVLIWSRCRCSFLISFFRSCSYFSCQVSMGSFITVGGVRMRTRNPTPPSTIDHRRATDLVVGVPRGVDLLPDLVEELHPFIHLLQRSVDLRLQLPLVRHGCRCCLPPLRGGNKASPPPLYVRTYV